MTDKTENEFRIEAAIRTEFGKGAARRTRRAGLIPAVLYGHGADPIHVALPSHQTTQLLRHANALLEIVMDGRTELALVKQAQREPRRQTIEHVDLLIVKAGERIEVEVPITLTGEPFSGTIALQDLQTLRIEVDATKVPERVEVSVEGLEDGTMIHAGDIELPGGAKLADPEDALVVSITIPRAEAETLPGEEGEEAAASSTEE